MAFEFEPPDGGDKKHHKQSHPETHSKLHNDAHKLLDKLHHDWQKAKPHLEHTAHALGKNVEHQAKSLSGTAKRELNGTATPSDDHKLKIAEKIVGAAVLPHVTIAGIAVKEGTNLLNKQANHNHHKNGHVEVHTPVKHSGSKM